MSRDVLQIRIDAELKEKLRVQADKEKRTMSNLIKKIIEDYLNK